MHRNQLDARVVFASARLAAAVATALLAAAIVVPDVIRGDAIWTLHSPSGGPPPARHAAAGGYDPGSGRLIIFGGDHNCTSQNDLWVLSGAATTGPTSWTQLAPSGTPPPARYAHSAVYDEINNRLIVFGGFAGSACTFSVSSRNDVWVLEHANGVTGTPMWTKLNPTGTAPAPRVRASAVYDPNTNRMIVFGGNPSEGNCHQGLADTWVLTNANGVGGTPAWMQLATGSPAPSPRSAQAAGYDPATNRMMVFGGAPSCQTGNNDVWVLQNANGIGGAPVWTQLTVPGTLPAVRAMHAGVYDPVRNELTIYGGGNTINLGDVWRLDGANGLGGSAWTKLWQTGYTASPPTPPPAGDPGWRNGHVLALDPASSTIMMFGGFGWNSRMNDAWIFTDAIAEPADSTPPVLSLPAAITAEATSSQGATVTFAATATDAVDGPVAIVCSPPSGATFGIGTTPVGCTATDDAGNTAADTFTVTVQDTTRPSLTCPDAATIAANMSGQAAVPNLAALATVFDYTPVFVQQLPTAGAMVGVGTTQVMITATDTSGNVSGCQTSVTVEAGGEAVSVAAQAGQPVTTDTENNDGATAADPIETTVTSPVAGTISIREEPASSSPGEFTFLGHVVHITAPAGNPDIGPARAIFMIDSSIVPAGGSASTIEVFKDGAIVPECTGGPDQPACITSRLTLGDGDVWIEVRTFNFSRWSFGVPSEPITASSVAALVQTLPLNGGQKNSLIVKLKRGQFAPFINEVQALQRSGRLDPATATGLIARAQAVVRGE